METLWGIQYEEVLLLLKQIGLAVAGATALWGFIFSIQDLKHRDPKRWIIDDLLSIKIFNLFLVGVVVSSVAYYMLIPAINALAHDGISVSPSVPETLATFPLMSVLFTVLIMLTLMMLLFRKTNEESFSDMLTPFYAIAFILTFVMTSFSGWRESIDSIQIFYFTHGFHSIFTLGSVIVIDYLFILSSHSNLLKQHVYKLFPTISKLIWMGLGFNLVSGLLILEHVAVTEKFLFAQTVVGILIINGVFLSGPVARKMIYSVQNPKYNLSAYWRKVGNVCGALSITSWLTISSIDFFGELTLSYVELLLAYATFFILAFVGHVIFDKIEKSQLPPALMEKAS